MASRRLKLRNLILAAWRGCIDQGKAAPGAGFVLGFLESLREQCRELDKEAIRDLAEQATSIEIQRIRTIIGELGLEADEIRKEVEDVTQAVARHLAERGELPAGLEDVNQALRELHRTARQTLATTQQTYDVALGVQSALARVETKLSDSRKEKGGFHAEIDRAVVCLEDGRPDAALFLLGDLRKKHWSEMDQRERFRLEANIGHAYMRQGKYEEAARQFLRARTHQPDDEDAMHVAIRAKAMLEDLDEARQLADEARAKFPESARILGLWLHLHAEKMTFAEMEEPLPTHMRSTYQVACALAEKAVNEQLLEEAERYARLAVDADRAQPYATSLLGQVILQRELDSCKPGISQERQVSTHRIDEALRHLTASIDACGQNITKQSALETLTARGVVHSLLGHDDLAEQDLLRARALAPRDAEPAYRLAIFRDRKGSTGSAIELLSSECDGTVSVKKDLLLAELLMERGQPGDRARALAVLLGRLGDWDTWEDSHKVAYAGVAVTLFLLLGQGERCLRFLGEAPVNGLPPGARQAFIARAELELGDKRQALRTAVLAREELTDKTDPCVLRELAWVFYKLGEYEEAKGLLSTIIEPLYISNETICLMECAAKAGDDNFLLDFCEQLRANGIYDIQTVDAEAVTLIKYNAYDEAISILQNVVAQAGDDRLRKIARARLSQFAILAGKPDLVEKSPGQLPTVEEAGAHYGRVVTQVLLHGDHPERAADFAYDLYRQYPDDFDVCSAVVESLGLSFHIAVPVERPCEVKVGCAVRFRDEATGREQWCIVEDAPDTKPTLQEFAPTHPLCRAMMGMHVGDVFAMPNAERQGTVLQIADKRVYRWHECSEEMLQKHPDKAWIWTFSVAQDPEFAYMAAILRSSRDRLVDGLDMYRKHLLPVRFLERVSSRNTFQNVLITARHSPLPIRCSFGNADELEHAAQALSQAEAVVLDVTAVATLFMLERLKEVIGWPLRLVITQGVWDQVSEALRALEHPSSHYADLVPSEEGERVAAIPCAEDVEEKGRLYSFCDLVRSEVCTQSGAALLRVDRACRDRLLQITGRPSAESIALASEMDAVVWVDDCVVGGVAARELGVRCAWTQAVFDHAAREGWIKRSVSADVTFAILGWGYRHTMITAELIREAALRSRWVLDQAPLSHVLDQFANNESVPEGLFFLAGATIRWAWQHAHVQQLAEGLTIRIMERLASRKAGHEIIRALAASMDMLFGLDVVNGQRAKVLVEQWLRASNRVVSP